MSEATAKPTHALPSRGARVAQTLRYALLHNLGLKFLSLLAAFALWLFVNGGARDSESALQIPVQLQNLPEHLMIVNKQVSVAEVRISGPRALLTRLVPSELAIRIDLEGVRPGPAVFRLSPDQLNLPRGVRVVRLTPSEVTLQLARVGRRELPVHLAINAKPANGLRLTETKVLPEHVEVLGPLPDINELKAVDTVPIDLSDLTVGTVERDVLLEPPPEFISYSSFLVRAHIKVDEPEKSRLWKRVSVLVSNASGPIRVTPDVVNVTVRGPRSVIESLELEHGAVYIDAAGLPPGRHTVVPTVDLPGEVELIKLEPANVAVQILEERRKTHGR